MRYNLARADTGAVLFNDVVKASYTAKLGDELVALLRQRLAKEGAVRANIAALLERLKSLLHRRLASGSAVARRSA